MVLCPQSALKPSAFTLSSALLCLPKLMQHILGAEAKHIILISVFFVMGNNKCTLVRSCEPVLRVTDKIKTR